MGRQELLLHLVGFCICLYAQQQIIAKPCPRIILRECMNHVSIGNIPTLTIGIIHFSLDMADYHIPCSCRTVIVKEVIAILCILRHGIFDDSQYERFFFGWRQVEQLFFHPSPFHLILMDEIYKRGNSHHVIGKSENKPKHEVLLLERKQSIIRHDVTHVILVVDAYGSMTIQGIRLVSLPTGYQRNVNRIQRGI